MHRSFYTLSPAPQARFPTLKTSPCHEAYIGPELMGPNAAEAKTRVQATVALSAKTPHRRQRMGSLRRNLELSYLLRYFHLPGLIFSSQGAAFSTTVYYKGAWAMGAQVLSTPQFIATYLAFSGKLKTASQTQKSEWHEWVGAAQWVPPLHPVFLSVKCVYHTMLMVTRTFHNLHSSQKYTQEHSEHNKVQTKEVGFFCLFVS